VPQLHGIRYLPFLPPSLVLPPPLPLLLFPPPSPLNFTPSTHLSPSPTAFLRHPFSLPRLPTTVSPHSLHPHFPLSYSLLPTSLSFSFPPTLPCCTLSHIIPEPAVLPARRAFAVRAATRRWSSLPSVCSSVTRLLQSDGFAIQLLCLPLADAKLERRPDQPCDQPVGRLSCELLLLRE